MVTYEEKLKVADDAWQKAFNEALNGNVNQNRLSIAMHNLNQLEGIKLQQEIKDLESEIAKSYVDKPIDKKVEKYILAKQVLKDDIKRLREKLKK